MTATSVGPASTHDEHAVWWGAGGRLGAASVVFSKPLALALAGELLGTLTRNRLTVDGAPVYTYGPASGGLGAALAWRFP